MSLLVPLTLKLLQFLTPPPSARFCQRSLPVKREHFLPTVVKLLLKRDHLIVPHKINHLEEMLV